MKKTSRIFLFGALIFVLVAAGCAGQEGTSTPIGATQPGGPTSIPTELATETAGTAETQVAGTAETATSEATSTTEATATTVAAGTQETPVIPVTGRDVILLECQFCVDTIAHALLVIPATATFELVTPSASVSTTDAETGCNTVDTFHDRQLVLCRAPETTSLTLNICTDANTCSQLSVNLQSCPVAAATSEPGSATNTPGTGAETSTATPLASPTADTGLPTSTPTP